MSEAKAWLRQDYDDDDVLIASLLTAARQSVENYLDRALITQTWDLHMDTFRDIQIPRSPLQSVTSISYVDDNGDTQTVDTSIYDVFAYNDAPGHVRLGYSQSWPSHRSVSDAVTIRFVAGYAEASPVGSTVPQPIKHGILLLLAEYYENREINVVNNRAHITSLPQHIERLLWAYKVHGFGV